VRARGHAAGRLGHGHRCGREQGRDVGIKGGGWRAVKRAGHPGASGPRVVPVITEEAAAERVAAVLAERDAVQANLLELDGSFAKRVLEGATLTGATRDRWASASAALATLWETFLAYSAVVDRAAALGTGPRRPARKDLPELSQLLTGGCVQLPGPPVPLARRDVAAAARPPVTLATAVGAMRRSFTQVTEVTSAVESVWAALGPPLDAATQDLARCAPLAAGLGAETEAELSAVSADLQALRAATNADPLALWEPAPGGTAQAGRVDTSAATRLRTRTAALAARIAELDRVRQQARQRIGDLTAAVAGARADRQDAVAAWQEAAARVSALPAPPPDVAEPPLAGLDALAGRGQWSRLAAELERCEAELAASGAQTAELRRTAQDALGRRDELRGLLRAYKAKAARLGAAEDAGLADRHERAYGLLWTAPCDLAAAEAAVAAYQRAILATEGRQ
jgi:hypothetical protein